MMKRSVPALLIKELAYEICIIYGGPRDISRPCGMCQLTLSGTRVLPVSDHRDACPRAPARGVGSPPGSWIPSRIVDPERLDREVQSMKRFPGSLRKRGTWRISRSFARGIARSRIPEDAEELPRSRSVSEHPARGGSLRIRDTQRGRIATRTHECTGCT